MKRSMAAMLMALLVGASVAFAGGLWALAARDDLLGMALAGLGAATLGLLVRVVRFIERRAR